ncbi:MAG: hypothetical protein JWP74_2731 [Marmoricola sp.]|nr:hypothetical protein [Marmoricola sp.]
MTDQTPEPEDLDEDLGRDESPDVEPDVDVDIDVDILADDEFGTATVTTETGHPAVDEVLRSLGVLDNAPVDEHVAVFEQAHDRLRRTLSGADDDQA